MTDPTINTYFTMISVICSIILFKKYIFHEITQILYLKIKANITSRLTVRNLLVGCINWYIHKQSIDCLQTCNAYRVCCQRMPDNLRDRIAKLKVERKISTKTSMSYIRNDPTIKTYLTVINNICGIGLCPKNDLLNNTKSVCSN